GRCVVMVHQQVSLGVDIGCDVMRHLTGVVAQSDPAVEGYRTEPDRTAIRSLVKRLPESDVVPPVRALALGLLERELFLLSFIVKRTDRRVVVWPVKHHTADDLHAR